MQYVLRLTDASGLRAADHNTTSSASWLLGGSPGAALCRVWQMGRRSAQSNAVGREEGSMGRRSRTQYHDASPELNGDHRGEGGFETRSWPALAYLVR